MIDMICRKTLQPCQTPGMCAPHGGCQPATGSLLAGEHRRTTVGHAADVWPDGMEVVPADDLDALQQRCRELEHSLQVKEEFYQDALHSHVVLARQRDALRDEVERLRKLFSECAEYLNINKYTSIGHGSILHRKMTEAAMEATQCTSTDTTGSTPEA